MSGLEPGFQLRHYRILRSLGSGGMADVYEAHDENLERTVALKVLPIEYCRNPQLVQRFQKEVRAAAKLNHRNIVTVYEVGQQDSYHFFSMRLLTGGDLRRRIEQGLTPVESLAILRELADAFAHAHARGFVHRDVKPENVMFDEQGFPVLTDFGIAKALDANTHMTRTGMTMGTPRYLSPEQASGKPVDARADLYSLGVMFFEMLTGRPPYDAEESMAVIFKHVTEPIPVLPPDFGRYQPLLEKLMAKDANQRIASAADLIREIDAIVPRQATAELKQSQLRTAENPLIAQLMTPSPLRTPPPKTPPPKTPAPAMPPAEPVIREMTGEVAVQVAPAAARAAVRTAPSVGPRAATVAPAAAPVASAPAPSRRLGPAIIGGSLAAAAAVAAVAFFALRPQAPAPVPVPAPAAVEPDAAARAEAARRDAEQRAAAERYARQQAETEAAEREAAQKSAAGLQARQQAETQAKQQAEAEARQRAQAQAEARKRAEAEAEAQRRAEAQAEAQRRAQAEAEARKRAEAEDAARRKGAEEPSLTAEEIERRAREADRAKAAARNQKQPKEKVAEKPPEKKKEEPAKSPEQTDESEAEAVERAHRPVGF